MFSKFKLAIDKDIKISPELWTQLQEFGRIRYLKKNEYLLQAGQVCKHGYFINSGSLIKTFLNQNGKEIVQGFYIDKDYAFLSEVTSYFSKKPSDFQIKAIENCELIEFSESQLKFLADNFQEFALFYHKITAKSYQNLYMFSAMRLSLNAEDFLIFLYNQHPIYMQRIPDKYIAQFMGISKEWLSKLKKKVFKPNSKND
ncbi:MAG: cyclic nucleotide-binding domain-containing protein [Bacteroidales bacterium]|nr:cyclic nucleotide-binding domain-containing protein [Bacteroidales bacterium]